MVMVGNGVGRWNTIPMRRRSWTGSTPASYTSAPSSSTEPVTQPPPDGPITAVTVCAGNSSDTSLTTARRPYRAVSRTASSWSRASTGCAMPLPDGRARGQGQEQHQAHQDERRRPRQAVPFVEGAGAVHEDLQRQGLHRLQHVGREVQVSQGGEQERQALRDAVLRYNTED